MSYSNQFDLNWNVYIFNGVRKFEQFDELRVNFNIYLFINLFISYIPIFLHRIKNARFQKIDYNESNNKVS